MGVPFFARRFVAGETLAEGLQQVEVLNQAGIHVSVDALGENVSDPAAARASTDEYLRILDGIAEKKLNAHISVKLTMLGLDISENLCREHMIMLCRRADDLGLRLNIDMEGSAYTERTIAMYEVLARQFQSPEIVLQAQLRRTVHDVERVLRANGRLRLCKGAYKESAETALQGRAEIVPRYKQLVERLLREARHVNIATHDDELLDFCKELIAREGIPRERYEFQMLYGMREPTWHELVKAHPMTVYLPYGTQWFAYYRRRLMERKENVMFVMRNLIRS